MNENDCILSVRGLDIRFNLRGRVLHAIRGIDLDLYRGEVLAVVGESGSGKSVFTKSFMGLLDTNGSITGGTIDYCPTPGAEPVRLSGLKTEKDWLRIRGREIAMIMQDPMTSLNPLKTIGDQILEAVTLHQGLKGTEARARTLEYLRDVGISDPEVRFKQYPHEFSGGMRQRVVIAIAVACSPKILICDEPTTALDVTIQAKILELIRRIQKERGISVIYITHDLGVVAKVADYVDVMYAGKIVETGTIDEIFYEPRHPYTWGLLSAMPDLDTADDRLYTIPGSPPNLLHEKQGDAFAPRNHYALNIDDEVDPPMFKISDTHEWSLVIWIISSPITYNLLSPTLATLKVLSNMLATTNVVPIPLYSSDSPAFLRSSVLTSLMLLSIVAKGSLPSDSFNNSTSVSTVYLDAVSPALCPPIPSATINRLGRHPISSSFA